MAILHAAALNFSPAPCSAPPFALESVIRKLTQESGGRSGLSRVLLDTLHALAPQRRERLRAKRLPSPPLALPLLPASLLRLERPRLATLVRPLPAMRRLRPRKNFRPPGHRWQLQMAEAHARLRRLPLPRLPRTFLQRVTLPSSPERTRIQASRRIPHRLIETDFSGRSRFFHLKISNLIFP